MRTRASTLEERTKNPVQRTRLHRLVSLLLIILSVLIQYESVLAGSTNEPRTLVELNEWYAEPPAGQNAATLYLMGFAAMRLTESDRTSTDLPLIGKAELPNATQSLPPEVKDAIAAFVENNRGAIWFFIQAARHGQSRYPIDLTQGQATLLPHLLKLREGAKLLELFVISQAVAGEEQLAGNGVLTALAMARSLDSEPFLISQHVRASLAQFAISSLEQALNRTELPPETLDRLQETLVSMEEREVSGIAFSRALTGEKVIGLSAFNMLPEDYVKVPPSLTGTARRDYIARIEEKLADDKKLYKSTFAQATAARDKPFPSRLSQDEIFQQGAIQATNARLFLSSLVLPGLAKSASIEAGTLAWLRLARTAVALEKFRRVHDNHYPESLRELTFDSSRPNLADPFDGKTLRYQTENAGFTLYSIGPNARDDRGKKYTGGEGDLVIRVIKGSAQDR